VESPENGVFFVALHGTAIVAAAGVFDVANSYVELGATGVDVGFRGHKLQRILALTRVAAVVANQGRLITPTTAIKPSNQDSQTNMRAVGFVNWTNPIPEMLVPCAPCPERASANLVGRPCCCEMLILPRPQKHDAVISFLTQVPGIGAIVRRSNRANTSEIEVEMNTIIATGPHRQDLDDYARTGP
jgi:hypothetical protein